MVLYAAPLYLGMEVMLLITLLSGVFPNGLFAQLDVRKDPPGTLLFPTISNPISDSSLSYVILVIDGILFGTMLLSKWKSLDSLTRIILRVSHFELPVKLTVWMVLIMLGSYAIINYNQILTEETEGDYSFTKEMTDNFWSNGEFFWSSLTVVNYSLLYVSDKVLGNIRILPFVASIALLLLTYLTAREMSGKRLAGVVSMGIIMQSGTYLSYQSQATHNNFWVLFYLLSLYLILKKPVLSPVSYAIALLSKPFVGGFIPANFVFSYMNSRRILMLVFGAGIVVVVVLILSAAILGVGINLNEEWFLRALMSDPRYQLSIEPLLLTLLPFVVVTLYVLSQKSLQAANALFLLTNILWAYPLLAGFTGISSQQYRFIALIVAFALATGILFSRQPTETSTKRNMVAIGSLVASLPMSIILQLSIVVPDYASAIINLLSRI